MFPYCPFRAFFSALPRSHHPKSTQTRIIIGLMTATATMQAV